MDCRESCELLPLSVDGELDARTEAALAAHLASCLACAGREAQLRVVGAAMSGTATYYRAPTSLRERLDAALWPVNALKDRAATSRQHGLRSWPWRLLNGAGLIAAICTSLLLVLVWPQRPANDDDLRIANELIANHARARVNGHMVDVASSDQHTVKPWFAAKLDFSPPVHDFSDQGFSLIGGRLDYLDHHSAAVLIYGRRLHTIEVFVWPVTTADPVMRRRTVRGYQVVGWATADLAFRAVSDVEAAELDRLSGLFQDAAR
jgi:anti-sigma factor RsiW